MPNIRHDRVRNALVMGPRGRARHNGGRRAYENVPGVEGPPRVRRRIDAIPEPAPVVRGREVVEPVALVHMYVRNTGGGHRYKAFAKKTKTIVIHSRSRSPNRRSSKFIRRTQLNRHRSPVHRKRRDPMCTLILPFIECREQTPTSLSDHSLPNLRDIRVLRVRERHGRHQRDIS